MNNQNEYPIKCLENKILDKRKIVLTETGEYIVIDRDAARTYDISTGERIYE